MTNIRFKSIEYMAKQLHQDPADVSWDIVLGAQPKSGHGIYFMMSKYDIATALRWPWMSIGSDAGANEAPGKIDAMRIATSARLRQFSERHWIASMKKRHVLTLEVRSAK